MADKSVEKSRDANLARVMKDDGVKTVDTHGSFNQIHTRLADIKAKMGNPPWSVRLIYNETMSAVMICQAPGEGNRTHLHENEDEWWVIMEGELEWTIEGMPPVIAKKDDIVFVPRKKIHNIRSIGTVPSIRLAIGVPDVTHVYV